MTIYIAADHAGYKMKEILQAYISELGYDVVDMGNYSENSEDDYPDFIFPLAREVADDSETRRGIVLGGSGIGEAIAANRVKGIRAAVYFGGPIDVVTLSRSHNDANVLALGARFLSANQAMEAVRLWLDTPFSNESRHVRRIAKIDQA